MQSQHQNCSKKEGARQDAPAEHRTQSKEKNILQLLFENLHIFK